MASILGSVVRASPPNCVRALLAQDMPFGFAWGPLRLAPGAACFGRVAITMPHSLRAGPLQKEGEDDIYEGFNNPAFKPQVLPHDASLTRTIVP